MTNKLKFLLASALTLAGCSLISVGGHSRSPKELINNSDYAKTAVMITSNNMRSGGTGVILDSHPGVSHVLTNKHVCELVQVGGLVITDDGVKHNVDAFRVYQKHDLCLVEVDADLGVNIKVAQEAPKEYDQSIVVGHPALLPTLITVGHFAQSRVISLMVGTKPCDGTEDGDDAVMCILYGGVPILRQMEGQVTSATIMPGSSGSAVYNTKGELSGLIFAGERGLSYGFLVPWAYVNDFLTHKNQYKQQFPDSSIKEPKNFFTSYFKFESACNDNSNTIHAELCRQIKSLGIWNK